MVETNTIIYFSQNGERRLNILKIELSTTAFEPWFFTATTPSASAVNLFNTPNAHPQKNDDSMQTFKYPPTTAHKESENPLLGPTFN